MVVFIGGFFRAGFFLSGLSGSVCCVIRAGYYHGLGSVVVLSGLVIITGSGSVVVLSGLLIIVAPGSVVVLSGLFIIVPFPGLGETIVSHGGSMVVHSSFVPLDPSGGGKRPACPSGGGKRPACPSGGGKTCLPRWW
ncbi:MAG: hypothetical protein CM15mP62_24340 [Rhodospirillaceae bacterium]|nr:MAG: hypothetical protein CM15mP62_24340 [Rhodospirillaceae bacterium]